MQTPTLQKEQPHTAPAIEPENLPPLLAMRHMVALYTVGAETVMRLVAAGAIPAPVVDCARTRRWNRAAVLASLQQGAAK